MSCDTPVYAETGTVVHPHPATPATAPGDAPLTEPMREMERRRKTKTYVAKPDEETRRKRAAERHLVTAFGMVFGMIYF